MSRLAAILASLLVLLALSVSPFPASAQPIAASLSASLSRLRGQPGAARPVVVPAAASTPSPAEPVDAADQVASAGQGRLAVASIAPHRTAEEELMRRPAADQPLFDVVGADESALSGAADDGGAAASEEADSDEGQVASIAPYRAEAEVGAAEDASLSDDSAGAWTGEVASILPYGAVDADEAREAAEEEEDSDFGVARIVPFDSNSAVELSDAEPAVAADEAPVLDRALNDSEWAKRSRVRRSKLRRWLAQRKLGEPVIYSH